MSNVTHESIEREDRTLFGLWVYLLTDAILFATLFATYVVLRDNTYGGPSAANLFDLEFVFIETLLLLASSFAVGLTLLAARKKQLRQTIVWLVITLLLGAGFLAMELSEFAHLVASGNSWQRSGFLTAFFTLVGTHGAHILVGLLWGGVLIAELLRKRLSVHTVRRLALFSLFWHFLDIIWIFVFTIVYLMGGV